MSFGASREIVSKSWRIAGPSPTMEWPSAFSAVSLRFWTRSVLASSARSTTTENSSASNGLVR